MVAYDKRVPRSTTGWNEDIKYTLGHCGQDVYIGHNTIITSPERVILHDRVRIDPFCLITTSLEAKSNVLICSHTVMIGGSDQTVIFDGWNWVGYGSKLFTASEDYSGEYGGVNEFHGSNKSARGDIHFKKFSGLASEVMVFPDIIFPRGCAIGAKSLVHTKDKRKLKSWNIYVGSPLKNFGSRNSARIIELSEDKDWIK